MLITAHVFSGALVGRLAGRTPTAFGLGVVSHLAVDRVPHWGRPLPDGVAGLDGVALRVAVVDGLLGLALLGSIARLTASEHRPAVLAGMLGACLPDLDKPYRLVHGGSPWPAWFDAVHERIQRGRESPHRLRRDAMVSLVGGIVTAALLAAERRRALGR